MYTLGLMYVPLFLGLRGSVEGQRQEDSDFKASLVNTPSSKLIKAAWKGPVSNPMTKLHTHTHMHTYVESLNQLAV